MRERIENGALLGAFLTVSYCFLVWIKWHNHWECADDSLKWTGFPLGLEKWEGIFQSGKSQGILNRLEKSGKNAQNTGKLR